MKGISLAVLALLGQVSAITLRNAANQEQSLEERLEEALEEGRPDDTILLQTQADINLGNHHKNRHHSLRQAGHSMRNKQRDQPPYIYPKKDAAEWFELDNMDERVHGSVRFEETDD